MRTATRKRAALTMETLVDAVVYMILLAGAVAVLVPFAWMVSSSLKSNDEIFAHPPTWIPSPILWSNYAQATQTFPFIRYALNSVCICVLSTMGALVSCSLAGFAFATMRFKGREALFMVLMATLMIPPQVTMIPTFLLTSTGTPACCIFIVCILPLLKARNTLTPENSTNMAKKPHQSPILVHSIFIKTLRYPSLLNQV